MTINLSQTLTVPLDNEAHDYAKQFAAEQATVAKGKQVYLNTLAVYAVRSYLNWLSIKTALHQSDCWHPGFRAIFDVADLMLPNIGKLECRPVLPGEETVDIPPEVSENCIGYMAVEFSNKLDRVELLGFLPAKAIAHPAEPIPLWQFQPLDSLINTIDRQQLRVNIRQWFEGIYQPGWQPVDALLSDQMRQSVAPNVAPNVASNVASNPPNQPRSIRLGKVIDWQNDDDLEISQRIILTVRLKETSATEMEICLRLYPDEQTTHLPANLKVSILDESGVACMDAEAREADDWIELTFDCEADDRFTVEIALGDRRIREEFWI